MKSKRSSCFIVSHFGSPGSYLHFNYKSSPVKFKFLFIFAPTGWVHNFLGCLLRIGLQSWKNSFRQSELQRSLLYKVKILFSMTMTEAAGNFPRSTQPSGPPSAKPAIKWSQDGLEFLMSSHVVLQARIFPLDVIFLQTKNPPIASKLTLQSFFVGLSVDSRETSSALLYYRWSRLPWRQYNDHCDSG